MELTGSCAVSFTVSRDGCGFLESAVYSVEDFSKDFCCHVMVVSTMSQKPIFEQSFY
jgi:hypothetical protein